MLSVGHGDLDQFHLFSSTLQSHAILFTGEKLNLEPSLSQEFFGYYWFLLSNSVCFLFDCQSNFLCQIEDRELQRGIGVDPMNNDFDTDGLIMSGSKDKVLRSIR